MAEPLRIFYDARTIRPGMTGIGRATLSLLAALAEREDLRIRALILEPTLAETEFAFLKQLRRVGWIRTDSDYESHPWGDFALRFKIPKLVAPEEVYHGPAFTIPGGRQAFARVVTIHDAGVFLHPEFHSARFAAYLRWVTRRSCAAADRIIVPSVAVLGELTERFALDAVRIDAVPEAGILDPVHSPKHLPEACRRGDYVITIGTLEARKDPLAALAALERLPNLNWIWIGSPGHGADEILERVRHSPAANRFHLLGPLCNAETAAALAGAKALIASSRYEGFGLPVAEAMEAGVPVIASDLPVFREVAGEAADFFPPGNAAALAARISELLADPRLARERAQAAKRQAGMFSWALAAERTAEVYRRARGTKLAAGSR